MLSIMELIAVKRRVVRASDETQGLSKNTLHSFALFRTTKSTK